MPHVLNDEERQRGIDQHRQQISGPARRPSANGMASEDRVAPRKQPEFAAGGHRRSLDPRGFGEGAGGDCGDQARPSRCRGAFPTSRARASASPAAGHRARRLNMRAGSGCSRSVARRLATRSSGVDSSQQAKPGAEPAAREADRAAERQRQRRPDQPRRPDRASPSAARSRIPRPAAGCSGWPSRFARRARRASKRALEIARAARRVSASNGSPPLSSARTRSAPSCKRAAEQRRLQVPVAEHRRGRAEQVRVDHRHARPARFGVDPLERRHAPHRPAPSRPPVPPPRPVAATRSAGRRDAVADQQDHRARLEPADRFVDVADRKDADARRGAAARTHPAAPAARARPRPRSAPRPRPRRSAPDIRASVRPASGSKARKPAAIVFLIGADQRAERHSASSPASPWHPL